MDTILPSQLATITTDTGAFAPGRKNFARYDTPALCAGAAYLAWQTVRTYVQAEWDDSVGAGVAARVARSCGAQFTLANTPAHEWRFLFELALYAQHDSLAISVLPKLIAQTSPGEERDALYRALMRQTLNDGRGAVADAIFSQLEKGGTTAEPIERELLLLLDNANAAHVNLDDTWWAAHIAAPRRHQAAERAIALGTQPALQDNFAAYLQVFYAYRELLSQAAERAPDSVALIAHRVQHDLAAFSHGMIERNEHTIYKDFFANWWSVPLDTVIGRVGPLWYVFGKVTGGVRAPRLTANYWFPAPGRPVSDTVRPVPGKVNLICLGGGVGAWNFENDWWLRSSFAKEATDMQRWLATYGPAGLEITLVWPTGGFMDGWAVGDHQQEKLMTLAEKARAWRWLVQDYHKLPVTVAVQATHYTFLPEPDGRPWTKTRLQINQFFWHEVQSLAYGQGQRVFAEGGDMQMDRASKDTMPQDSLSSNRPGEEHYGCVVIDRAGQIVYVRDRPNIVNDNNQAQLEDVLKWQFSKFPVTPGVGPSKDQQRAMSTALVTPRAAIVSSTMLLP